MPQGRCVLCGRIGFVHTHHAFEGGGRKKRAEKYGLLYPLCPDCHTLSDYSAHRCTETALKIKRAAQRKFERESGTREEFIKIFGRNYL